jgi:iron complex transport system substrate-binding protein
VLSLHPAATEILVAMGATDLLVARMEGDGASLPNELPSVGEMLTPNLEVVASVAPDLVITWQGYDAAALARVLEGRGGKVVAVAIDRLADVAPAIAAIGGWIGRPDAARGLVASFSAALAGAAAHRADEIRPRVLWVVWSEPIVVAGPGTFIHDVIELAGGENAADAVAAPWPRLGLESLVALAPDVLVWPDGPGLFAAAELTERTGWRTLAAVEAGRVLEVDAERFHDAGPAIAEGVRDLARRLALVRGR